MDVSWTLARLIDEDSMELMVVILVVVVAAAMIPGNSKIRFYR
jgi:hypothetical protein